MTEGRKAERSDEKKKTSKLVAIQIAVLVLPLMLLKRPVLNAALVNTKMHPIKPVVSNAAWAHLTTKWALVLLHTAKVV